MSCRKALMSSAAPGEAGVSQSLPLSEETKALSGQLTHLAQRLHELGGPAPGAVFGGTDLASLEWRVEAEDKAWSDKAGLGAPPLPASATDALARAEDAARCAVAASLASAGAAVRGLGAAPPGTPSSWPPEDLLLGGGLADGAALYSGSGEASNSEAPQTKQAAILQQIVRERAARQEQKRQERIQRLRDEADTLKQAARADSVRQASNAAASEAVSAAGNQAATILDTARAHMSRFEDMLARGETGAALRCLHQATAALHEARLVVDGAGVKLVALEELSRKLTGMHERVGHELQQQEHQRGGRQPPTTAAATPAPAAEASPATCTTHQQPRAAAEPAVVEAQGAKLQAWTRRAEESTTVRRLGRRADLGALSKHIQVRDNCGEEEADDIASSLIEHLQHNDMCGTEDTAPAFPAQVAAAAAQAAANELKSARVAHAAALAAAQRARDTFDKLEGESNVLTGKHGARGGGGDDDAVPLLFGIDVLGIKPLLSILNKAIFGAFRSEHEAFVSIDSDRSGDISFGEWEEALRGQADEAVLRQCFQQMDSDKDGKLSQAEFNAGLARLHFIK